MTGYKSKKEAAQDKMAHITFEQRCRLSEQCLPEAPYRAMLTKLHGEMLDALLYRQADYLAQPEQEPVAEIVSGVGGCLSTRLEDWWAPNEGDKLYTTSPQREWAGLKPEEILDLFDVNNVYGSKWIEFARAVEAKLKEKNNG